MQGWWSHFLHWWDADRITAVATSVAAISAAAAVIATSVISRRSLADARAMADTALQQARQSSQEALEQNRRVAREDRRSAHQLLIYDRVAQLRGLIAHFQTAVAGCHSAALACMNAQQHGTESVYDAERHARSAFDAAESAGLRVDECLVSIELLLSKADPQQVELESRFADLRPAITAAMRLLVGLPFTPAARWVPPAGVPAEVSNAARLLGESISADDLLMLQGDFNPLVWSRIAGSVAALALGWVLTESQEEVRRLLPPLTGDAVPE